MDTCTWPLGVGIRGTQVIRGYDPWDSGVLAAGDSFGIWKFGYATRESNDNPDWICCCAARLGDARPWATVAVGRLRVCGQVHPAARVVPWLPNWTCPGCGFLRHR